VRNGLGGALAATDAEVPAISSPCAGQVDDPRRMVVLSGVADLCAAKSAPNDDRRYAAAVSALVAGALAGAAPKRAFSALRCSTSFSRSSSTRAGRSAMYWQALSRP